MLCLALMLVALSAGRASAHRVYVFAWTEGDRVHTESYFSSNKKVNGGRVQVFDLAGHQLLEGKTDPEGLFTFKKPGREALKITVEASMGHRGEFILERPEDTASGNAPPQPVPREEMSAQPVAGDAATLRALLLEVLDSRLQPLHREIAELRKEKEPGLREIAGGIGYILGIMGLAMYLRSRRRTASESPRFGEKGPGSAPRTDTKKGDPNP